MQAGTDRSVVPIFVKELLSSTACRVVLFLIIKLAKPIDVSKPPYRVRRYLLKPGYEIEFNLRALGIE